MSYFRLLKPFLYRLSPETAHHAAITALKAGLVPAQTPFSDPMLNTSLFGLHFPNPIGLAAGFDKNAECIPSLSKQGFGFIEVGTVTPKPQEGNPKPRLFRLEEDEAIINRMGFNNKGSEAFKAHLATKRNCIVGANIGKNKTTEDAVSDYVFLLEEMYPYADYITINISSPNTPGLRSLQTKEALENLLSATHRTYVSLAEKQKKSVPLLLKIAPDVTYEEMEAIAEAVLTYKVDGVIISNTTISLRETLRSPHKNEQGGLSGKPLFALSTEKLATFYGLTKGQIPLIGVGGIRSGADAYAKILAGASLVQIYSALIFHGFDLVTTIQQELVACLQKDGFRHVQEAVGKGQK